MTQRARKRHVARGQQKRRKMRGRQFLRSISATIPSGGLTLSVGTQKWELFLKSTEATPCGHFTKWKLTPKSPCGHHVHGRHGQGFPVKKSLKIFKVLWKIQNFERHYKNLDLAGKWIWRAQISLVWKLVFRATHSVLQHFWAQKKNHSNDLERSKFRQQVQSFVCVPPWRRVASINFGKCLKMPQR